ncbi:hypothetical protein [Thalassotalea atypica]|uniref:hypothetical protein n=1 Tax=Thalassotalea atypica TaxID=2054316 RepID=UPI002573210D|nr:hypothetical protein [Thalassotalea atypica]
MPFTKHLAQGQLLYFTRHPNAISVSENRYYRWLAFDDVIQSVMNTCHPSRLTLPHHYALLMPLMSVLPAQITEFGLGGGNIARFIRTLSVNLKYQVIETDLDVIRCFQQFFNVEQNDVTIAHLSALQWIEQQQNKTGLISLDYQWFVYDIYQHRDAYVSANNTALFLLIKQLTVTQALTINLPFVSAVELSHLIKVIKNAQPGHLLTVYNVPHHQNKILHLLPGLKHRQQNYVCPLPAKKIKYWRHYHDQFQLR